MQQDIHSKLKSLSALEELLTQCSVWSEQLKALKNGHQDHESMLLRLAQETHAMKVSQKSLNLQTLQKKIDSHLKHLPDLEELLRQCSNWSEEFNAILKKCEALEDCLKTLP